MKQDTNLVKIKSSIAKHFEMPYSFNRTHGSNDWCFENIAFRIGINQDNFIDDDIFTFYECYLHKFSETDGVMNSDFIRSMVLNCMLFMGKKINRYDEVIVEAFYERLERVYNFTSSNERIFYTEEEAKNIKSVPAVWKNAGIVRYEHTNPYLRLPNVYDLLGFYAMYDRNKETNHKIDQIMEYIFSNQYQEEVISGYGIGINGERGFVKSSFYSVGWDIGLTHLTPRQEMLYMILLSPVSSAKNTQWYKEHKERYDRAVEEGDSLFLSQLYSSARKTYWTSGCYLNLGRYRKGKQMELLISQK